MERSQESNNNTSLQQNGYSTSVWGYSSVIKDRKQWDQRFNEMWGGGGEMIFFSLGIISSSLIVIKKQKGKEWKMKLHFQSQTKPYQK